MDQHSAGVLWRALGGILDLLFPRRCGGCDRVDQLPLCETCLTMLEWFDPQECCQRCGNPPEKGKLLASDRLCPYCRERAPRYKQAVAALKYTGPLTKAVPAWKYAGERSLSPVFADLIVRWASEKAPKWWESIDGVVPVPHHPRTVRWRGFCPPEDLAGPLVNAFRFPYLPRALFKVRFTPPQTGLSRSARVANLNESTLVFDRSLVEGRTILVVDDVMTTGATLDECARALMAAGAKNVYGIVLARQTQTQQTDP